MRNVDPNEDSRLLREPSQRIATKPMVDPTQLRVHLERNIRQVLILLLLIESLLQQQTLRAHAKVDRAQPLDARVDIVVPLLQQTQDEADVLRVSEPLDRLRYVIERLAPPRIPLDGGQLIRGQNDRRLGANLHPAVPTLVRKRLDKVDQPLVPRAREAQRLHAVAHDEDLPVRHPAALVELDVEDVPAPILHARHTPAISHTGRGQLAAGNDGHLAGDANAERFEYRCLGFIPQAWQPILHDDRGVLGGPATCDPQHV